MTSIERSIKSAEANLRLEGMHVTEREKRVARECLSGKKSFDKAVSDVVKRYKHN